MGQMLLLGACRIGGEAFQREVAGNLERAKNCLNLGVAVLKLLGAGSVEQEVVEQEILGHLEGAKGRLSSWRPGLNSESPCPSNIMINGRHKYC